MIDHLITIGAIAIMLSSGFLGIYLDHVKNVEFRGVYYTLGFIGGCVSAYLLSLIP
jgi:hypothetical protein